MIHYAKTTKELCLEWLAQHVTGYQPFSAENVIDWFAAHYPRTDPKTVHKHLEGLCINNGSHRRHHPHVRSDTDWDYLYKLGPRRYRRFDPKIDPKPVYA